MPEPKYLKPKILLVDLPGDGAAPLERDSFNVKCGTFGKPYAVEANDCFVPVIPNDELPNINEQEVVFVDLTKPAMDSHPRGEKTTSPGEPDVWAKCRSTSVDPRPFSMAEASDRLNRMVFNGGIMVVFGQPRVEREYVLASTRSGSGVVDEHHMRIESTWKLDNWSFLELFSEKYMCIHSDSGEEIALGKEMPNCDSFFTKHLSGAAFRATFSPTHSFECLRHNLVFRRLFVSTHNGTVGGLILGDKPFGAVFLLPQVADKKACVYAMVTELLPDMFPRLFPESCSGRWVQEEVYEHPTVLALKKEKTSVIEAAKAELTRLDDRIGDERKRLSYLHGLLTEGDDELVDTVERSLKEIGFQKVINVDKALDGASNRQEDLQIHDASPILLVEVKGLAGQPKEDDTRQVGKYVLRRMREWNRTDVVGLCIVNHQRHIPPLLRDNANAFTAPQVQDAVDENTGLLTTWDLFRLIRGTQKWGWDGALIRGLLYTPGRISVIPLHYKNVGKVGSFYTQKCVVSVAVNAGCELKLGDTLGYCLPHGYFQETCNSLQVDKEKVKVATGGQKAGYVTSLARSDLPVGTEIFVCQT